MGTKRNTTTASQCATVAVLCLGSACTSSASGSGGGGGSPTTTASGAPVELPHYVGTPPPNAQTLARLSPTRFTPKAPTEDAPIEVLYDLGLGPVGTVGAAIYAGTDYVYWEQSTKLMRGPKSGNGPVEKFGTWDLYDQPRIRGDATHVYWVNRTKLSRRPHTGGPQEDVTLLWDHTDGDFQIDDRYVYVAMPGCPAITRIDKVTLAQELVSRTVPEPRPTSLAIVGDRLLCGSGQTLFIVRSWDEGLEPVATHPDWVHALFVHDNRAYWFGAPRVFSNLGGIWRSRPLDEVGPATEAESLLPNGPGNRFPDAVFDSDRRLSVAPSFENNTGHVFAYSVDRNAYFKYINGIGVAGGIASDGVHYYFTQETYCCVDSAVDRACNPTCCDAKCGAILRVPMTYLPPALREGAP
ncbi:MAG TPA: hypothetical protein VHP33_32035 [Polyangiaceae bacterium]|nr:hypothetical protein [Polyangiaceae bacterium]